MTLNQNIVTSLKTVIQSTDLKKIVLEEHINDVIKEKGKQRCLKMGREKWESDGSGRGQR